MIVVHQAHDHHHHSSVEVNNNNDRKKPLTELSGASLQFRPPPLQVTESILDSVFVLNFVQETLSVADVFGQRG